MGIYIKAVRDIAERAQAAADLAFNRGDYEEEMYAVGVEEVCRFMIGDAAATPQLIKLLRAGRNEGDDLPEDHPTLGYPLINMQQEPTP